MPLFTWDHLLRFVFETVTDVAFVPSLMVIKQRGRHFELFIGLFQFITSCCYNLSDALEVEFFLSARDWHKLNNVLSITFALHLCIFLMGNRKENIDNGLRYLAFCLVWITQMKDAFWMEKSQYTMYVVVPFTLLPVAKLILFGNRFFFNGHETARGLLALTVAFVFFYLGLDDEHDPYRVFHGCAQLAAGAALYFMWQMIPENNYKKTDAYLPHNMQLTLT
eukprot:m.330433 g.330433  ORF g.330433 m.330433 type:complete len:222 (-) comp16045_c1_seq2:64-729(-)